MSLGKNHHHQGNAATLDDLEKIIDRAIERVKGASENDICKFLPGSDGGYMHHFTLRKLATQDPEKLTKMLNDYILSKDSPVKLPPKLRAARGSRKRRDVITLTRSEIEDMINVARQTGRKDIVAKLVSKNRNSLPAIKKELISLIRQNKVDQDLWRCFAEAVATDDELQGTTL
ncbi:MAG: hypothetical protein K0S74_767 [Chlamydiales bacterium]|jgi:hypothetical protein|nr:hypothetical protein [Chlamydiales bacterium]